MLEVFFDPPQSDLLELLAVESAPPDQRGVLVLEGVVRIALVPAQIDVVVGPHQIELHAAVVARLEKPVVQARLQKRQPVVPVPVVDEDVDAVIGRRGDLHLHHVAVRLIDVAPKREARLVMPLELGRVLHHRLPLADAHRPEHFRPVVWMIRRPHERSHVVVFFRSSGSRHLSLCSYSDEKCKSDCGGSQPPVIDILHSASPPHE